LTVIPSPRFSALIFGVQPDVDASFSRISLIASETSSSSRWTRRVSLSTIVTRLPKRCYIWPNFQTDVAAFDDDQVLREEVLHYETRA
jgi:hypothetical protein